MTLTVLDSTKVTFSPGFSVEQVHTGFESRQILLEGVPDTVAPADITTELQVFGKVASVLPAESTKGGSTSAYRVTFAQAESALEAANALESVRLFRVRVTARVVANKSTAIGGGTLDDGVVLVEVPSPRQTGYVGYPTQAEADKAMQLATRKELRGMRITAKVYEGIPMVGTINVRYDSLPADATMKDLARFGEYESYMLDRPKYTSLSSAINGLRRMASEHGEISSFNVVPPFYRKYFRVWIHYTDPKAAAAAREVLHRYCPVFVGKQRIFAHHVQSLRYNLPPGVYDTLAHDINLLRSFCQDEDGTSISIIDRRNTTNPTAPVLLKLVSHNITALSKLKAAFDRLLRGEKVTENGQIVWNDFFGGRAGMAYLDELEQVYPKVKINRDPRRRTLALFGPEEERACVNEEILARAKLLRVQRKKRHPIPGDLIGVFLREDLSKLQNELGRENVWIDITHTQLVVCGDEDTQKVGRLAIVHAIERRLHRRPAGRAKHDTTTTTSGCPVCLTDPSPAVTLSCGHTYCKACLAGFLNAAVDNKTFPLTCLGDGAQCALRIPLSVAQQLLTPDEFDAVVRAAFLAHVHARPAEFRYCPTPDCPQVYRKSTSTSDSKRATTTVLQCPSCLVRICPHCDAEHHELGSCQDRHAEDEQLFGQWKMGHDVKDCPSCKAPIERMAGCNHMTCTRCKSHICWACLETFSTSQDVYEHMRGIHGGIGL